LAGTRYTVVNDTSRVVVKDASVSECTASVGDGATGVVVDSTAGVVGNEATRGIIYDTSHVIVYGARV